MRPIDMLNGNWKTHAGICSIRRMARGAVKRFARSELGTITVESVIILPLLLFGLQATYTYHNAYRQQSMALKANYAVSDYVSRVRVIDQDAVDGLSDLFQYMSRSSSDSWIRVTVIQCKKRCDKDNKKLNRIWSETSTGDGQKRHTGKTIREWVREQVPIMYKNQYAIVVETSAKYDPPFRGFWTGISPQSFEDLIVTTSREYDYPCFKNSPSDCPEPQS